MENEKEVNVIKKLDVNVGEFIEKLYAVKYKYKQSPDKVLIDYQPTKASAESIIKWILNRGHGLVSVELVELKKINVEIKE